MSLVPYEQLKSSCSRKRTRCEISVQPKRSRLRQSAGGWHSDPLNLDWPATPHYQVKAGLQHQAPSIPGDDLDLIHQTNSLLNCSPELLANQVSKLGNHNFRNVQPSYFLSAVAGEALSFIIDTLEIACEIERKSDLAQRRKMRVVSRFNIRSINHGF